MKVDSTWAPEHVDDDVVFRTTYYFRVYDYCATKDIKGNNPGTHQGEAAGDNPGSCQGEAANDKAIDKAIMVLSDSLYRFRMTGKASSWGTKVHFESGTLKSWELDPLGANVIFDKSLGRFRFHSQSELDDQVLRANKKQGKKNALEEVSELADAYEKLRTQSAELLDDSLKNLFVSAIEKAMEPLTKGSCPGLENRQKACTAASAPGANPGGESQIAERQGDQQNTDRRNGPANEENTGEENLQPLLADSSAGVESGQQASTAPQTNVSSSSGENGNTRNQDNNPIKESGEREKRKEGCPAGIPTKTGYQIFGPEGWETFDQDSRLIMAMSSSAAPLISVMKETSKRVLDAHNMGTTTAALVAANERNRAIAAKVVAEGILKDESNQQNPNEILQKVLGVFNQGQ